MRGGNDIVIKWQGPPSPIYVEETRIVESLNIMPIFNY